MGIDVIAETGRDQHVSPVLLRHGYRSLQLGKAAIAKFQYGKSNTLELFSGIMLAKGQLVAALRDQ